MLVDQVIMEIPAGFPLPSEIFNGGYENNTRTYLRKFVNLTHPQIVMADNQQVSFKSCKSRSGNPKI